MKILFEATCSNAHFFLLVYRKCVRLTGLASVPVGLFVRGNGGGGRLREHHRHLDSHESEEDEDGH